MSTPGLLHAFLLDGHGGGRRLDWAAVEAWSPNDGVVWVSLDYTEADAASWLATKSAIDPVMITALTDPDPRPRAVAHGEDLMLIVRGINLNEGASPEDMVSMRAWIEPRRIITIRHRHSHVLHTLADLLERKAGPRTPGDFAPLFVEKVVDLVVRRVDKIGDRVAECEHEVLGDPSSDLRSVLADQRRRAITLRRFLAPQREALVRLAAINLPWLDATQRARLAEAADDMTRTVEELDAARDRAMVTQEELASRVAEAANQRLYVLSIITSIFLPLGFVCGLLGVNVGGVPLQKDNWAFWALCGVFAVGVAIQLWIFRRRGWL
jgi:zinc transporter